MAGSGRRKRLLPSKDDAINPPHQRGKRATRDELQEAIEDASRSKASLGKVLNEQHHAIDKVRYFAEHPELPGADDREASATSTVVLTTDYIQRELHRRIDIGDQNREAASRSRQDALSCEIEALLVKDPAMSAKGMYRALESRVGVENTPIKQSSDGCIYWVDRSGKRRDISWAGLDSRLTRLRKKIRERG